MTEFCTCGSMMIGGHCTNKNCANKAPAKTASSRSSSAKSAKTAKDAAKSTGTRVRKASKCITYNLNDIKKENAE